MQDAHFAALSTKHSDLDARITDESRRPLPDAGLIGRLKREKLRLKEEMSRH